MAQVVKVTQPLKMVWLVFIVQPNKMVPLDKLVQLVETV